MRVLKGAAHFHFDFMHERLAIAKLFFHFARSAEQCAKFTRPPADKSRLILALKAMPPDAGIFQARHRARAMKYRRLSQRLLIDQDDAADVQVIFRSRFRSPSCAFSQHRENLRRGSDRKSVGPGKYSATRSNLLFSFGCSRACSANATLSLGYY